MHKTNCDTVRGFIDKKIQHADDTVTVSGWCFYHTMEIKPIRLSNGTECRSVQPLSRPDVSQFYKSNQVMESGWEETIPISFLPCQLQMEVENEWITVFTFQSPSYVPNFALGSAVPSYLVVDNFYEDPNAVRAFALSLDFKFHPNYHKGKRTDLCYRFDGLKERFEQLVGRKITNWEKYGTNGCFQYCIGGDQLVYHCDTQQYAGVLFLTPNAPVNTGTSLFRSVRTKKMKVSDEEHPIVFQNGFLDQTQFERVDTVGNVYNRLVLFDSMHIHAACEYFGTTKENGRLFQLFFFDLE
jgi:hypothetical protein